MTTVIVANGELKDPEGARKWLAAAELVIAADGGSRHCLRLGISPTLLVGDLDSVSEQERAAIERAGGEIRQYPRRKDSTDLALALEQARQRGDRDVVILAAIGGRWDQSLANLQLLASPQWSEMHIRMIDGPQVAELVTPGRPLTVQGQVGDLVSLIPLGGDVGGITTEGLEYPLTGESLRAFTTRGVSNVIARAPARVRVTEGNLLVITIHDEGGSPDR